MGKLSERMLKIGWKIEKITDMTEKLQEEGDEYEIDTLDQSQFHYSQGKWYNIADYSPMTETEIEKHLHYEENCVYQLQCDLDSFIEIKLRDGSTESVRGKTIRWSSGQSEASAIGQSEARTDYDLDVHGKCGAIRIGQQGLNIVETTS